nr:hypothetical protein [Tanacetum cinerariifolium]
MRLKGNDMWVWGQGHMGRSGEGLGTVQVKWGCTGMAGEEVAVLAGKVVKLLFRSRVTDVRANANASLSSSSHSNSFDLQQIVAALEDKLDIRMNRFEKSLNEMKNSLVTPTAPLKAVTEVCVTCG